MDKNDMTAFAPEVIAYIARKVLCAEYMGEDHYPMLHFLAEMHSTDQEQEKLLRRIEELLKKLDDS